MRTYTFGVKKGGTGSAFTITFEDTSLEGAQKQVDALYPPKHNAVVLVDGRPGDLEDHLGPETMKRLNTKKKALREIDESKKRAQMKTRAGLNTHE